MLALLLQMIQLLCYATIADKVLSFADELCLVLLPGTVWNELLTIVFTDLHFAHFALCVFIRICQTETDLKLCLLFLLSFVRITLSKDQIDIEIKKLCFALSPISFLIPKIY